MVHKEKKKTFDKKQEMKISGFHCVLKAFEKRPNDLIRLYLNEKNKNTFSKMMKFCVQNKLAYHIVTDEELENISQSHHHEGVCALFQKVKALNTKDYLRLSGKKKKDVILVLDGVKNPHNLGSILRSAAHFGVDAIILNQDAPVFSAATYRTSEGGAESLTFILEKDLVGALKTFQVNSYKVVSTSSHKGSTSLYSFDFADKVIIVMGEEREGVSPQIIKLSSHSLFIPGTNNVESLNVSVATSVILGEVFRKKIISDREA